MQDATAPFRADMVGSLLRTAPLKEARAIYAKSAITATQLAAVEDEEIRKLIAKQEEIGLKSSPTASSAAPGGTSTSSGGSRAASA